VAGQSIAIRTSWWQSALGDRGLPGEPPAAAELTRADVWRCQDDEFTLLWHALAWGAGRFRGPIQRRLSRSFVTAGGTP